MSYKFGPQSIAKLQECDVRLQSVLNEVIKIYDCSVICGFRTQADQNHAFKSGMSKVEWPNSKHNQKPSKAMDVVPHPLDWSDIKGFCYMAGIVMGVAHKMGVKLRWGGDFNMNNQLKDEKFSDLPHFELVE
jgi:peptidoglycan LD-endopeptidase CwlK